MLRSPFFESGGRGTCIQGSRRLGPVWGVGAIGLQGFMFRGWGFRVQDVFCNPTTYYKY